MIGKVVVWVCLELMLWLTGLDDLADYAEFTATPIVDAVSVKELATTGIPLHPYL